MIEEPDYAADPANPAPQKRLQIISGAIAAFVGVAIILTLALGAASCSQESKYASWDEKCENAFAHKDDIRDCKALGRNNKILVAE